MSNPTVIPNLQDLNQQLAALRAENVSLQAQVATLQGEKSALRNENAKYRQENENLHNELQEAKALINTRQQDLAAMAGDQLQNSAKSTAQQSASMLGLEQQQQGRGNLNNNDDHDDDDYNDDNNNNNDNTVNTDYRQDVQANSKKQTLCEKLANKYVFPKHFCQEDKRLFKNFVKETGDLRNKASNWMDRAVDFAKKNRTTITTYDQMRDWGKTVQQKAKQNKNNNQGLDAGNGPEQIRSSGKIRGREETLSSKAKVQPGE